MIDWDSACKIFYISFLVTFLSMGILTFIILIIGIIFTHYCHQKEELQE